MRYLGTLLFIYIACVFVVQAQTTPDRGTILIDAGGDKQHADLQFTASIIDQRYCSDGRLNFTLRYEFHNKKGETILFDKRSSIIHGYWISRNSRLATAGKHKIYVQSLLAIDGKLLTLDPKPDISQFVTLKAGESYSSEHEFRVLQSDEKLKPGSYVLQFTVLTWHYVKASNIEWRERWRDKGYLWTNFLEVEPVPFVIDKHPEFVHCR
jgi:hypothetical protein